MTPGNVISVLFKSTLLFSGGLIFLHCARRSAPAVRYLVSVALMLGSLSCAAATLLPEPAFILRVESFAHVAGAAAAAMSHYRWAASAPAIWLSGCVLVMLRYVTGCLVLFRLRRRATPVEPGVFTADVAVPLLTGLFRPAILLPRSAPAWPPEQRGAAIRHELAHLDRGDLWANFAVTAACAVYWFHPLAWALECRMRSEQEAACDDAVLESGFDPAAYAEALLQTARSAIGAPLAGESRTHSRMGDRAGLRLRLARLLFRAPEALRPMRSQTKAAFAGLLVALVFLSIAGPECVYFPGGSIDQPSVVARVEPRYTAEARVAGIQGKVVLSMTVCSDGLARDIVVEQGIDPGLDRNAVHAVEQWRFHPAQRQGTPVAVKARVAVNFRLRDLMPSRYVFPRGPLYPRA